MVMSAIEKNKAETGTRRMCVVILDKVVRDSLIEEVISGQRIEGRIDGQAI